MSWHRALLQCSGQHETVTGLTIAYKHELLSLLEREAGPAAHHLFLLIEGAMAAAAYDDPQFTSCALRAASATVLDAFM